MAHKRRPRSYGTMHDINVANLVDVVLVILIVFMISAPLMQSGINVDLPQVKEADATLSEGIVVTIDQRSVYYIDDRVVEASQFESRIKEAHDAATDKMVFLRADKSVTHGEVIRVMGFIKAAGIKEVGLVTKLPEGKLTIGKK